MKFISDYCLNIMKYRQKLEFISSVDCSYSGIILINISVFNIIQFSRKTTSAGKDLMLVMVFSALRKKFLGLIILNLFEW